jgi:hypothetical protein
MVALFAQQLVCHWFVPLRLENKKCVSGFLLGVGVASVRRFALLTTGTTCRANGG